MTPPEIRLEYNILEGVPKEPCKGRVFKYKRFSFPTKRGGYKLGAELIPMKKLSCPGCESCYFLEDGLPECDYDMIESEGLCDGDLVFIDLGNQSRDWETGMVDDYDHIITRIP